MKKLLLFTTILTLGLATSCSNDDDRIPIDYPRNPTAGGVVIGGVEWAKYNVDAPGTFVANPEDVGMLFQWNRQKGWEGWSRPNEEDEENREDEKAVEPAGWDSSTPTGTRWTSANDPCPTGWRVPTQSELTRLRNSPSIWTANWEGTGVSGRLFGESPYQIFLPAGGWRINDSGVLGSGGRFGFYWSSAQFNRANARAMWFSSASVFMNWNLRANGYSVRCVVE